MSGLLLAHQGGWDEILLVAGPMALVVLLVRLARKRADAIQAEREQPADRKAGASTKRRDLP